MAAPHPNPLPAKDGETAEIRPERAQADAGAQAPVGVLCGIGEIAAGGDDDDDLLGDRLELGAEVAGALERQDLLLLGLDAQMPERRLVERLHALGRHRHAHAADLEQRHGPEIDVAAAGDLTRRAQLAAAQPRHAERALRAA